MCLLNFLSRSIRKKVRENDRRVVLETTLADGAKEMALWKDTKLHLYERYKGGAITRESYVAQIENGKARMEELEQIRIEALAELDSMQTMTSTEEIADAELAKLSVVEAFDKDKLKALIDRVIVYDADAVEVVWKVDNPFRSEVSA